MTDFTMNNTRLVWWGLTEVTNATSLPRRWCHTMRQRTAWFIHLAIHQESDVEKKYVNM